MTTLAEILDRDAAAILASIRSLEPFHVVTFEIQVVTRPHRFGVYLKGADRKHLALYSAEFDSPQGSTDLDDWQFFELYQEVIRNRIVDRMFPTDLSDYYCVQMVRDEWNPCGDFA